MSTSPIRKRKKAQVSLEFVLLVMISFIFFTAVLMGVSKQLVELSSQRDAKELKDVTNRLREEIFLASIVQGGYYREFRLPEKINDKSYTLEMSNGMITGQIGNKTYRVAAPNVTGTPTAGLNIIDKMEGGEIYLS